MRILVIDDEPYVRAALLRVLGSELSEVIAASDAEEGLVALRAAPTHLAIVDVVLPGMDGVAAIKRMRAEFPGLRIIAMSGGGNFGLDEYRPDAIATCAYLAACRGAGAHGTIAKPFGTQELRQLIQTVMDLEPAVS